MNVDILFPDEGVQDDAASACVGWLTLLGCSFDSLHDAETYVTSHVDDHPHNTHFIIQPVGHWIACTKNTEVFAKNVETVSSSSNKNPAKGKHGSVNDLQKSAVDPTEQVPPTIAPMPEHEKKQQVGDHVARINALVTDIPEGVETIAEYANARHHLASLKAYHRNLQTLLQEAQTNRTSVEAHIHQIDHKHPAFRQEWRELYNKGLRESGFDANKMNNGTELSILDFMDF